MSDEKALGALNMLKTSDGKSKPFDLCELQNIYHFA